MGLICSFRQERASEGSLTTDDFFQWLNDHKHEVIRHQIEGNAELLSGITGLLQANREILLERFDRVNLLLAQLLSKMDGFQTVTHSIYPTVEFSEQAIGILRILVESGGEELILMPQMGGAPLLEVSGVTSISYGEQRFLEDDLDTLCQFDFLKRLSGASYDQYFRLTRRGAKYIEYVSRFNSNQGELLPPPYPRASPLEN